MAWRLHLTNQAIQRIHILTGSPTLLVVWIRRNRVAYYNLETGAQVGEHVLPNVNVQERQSDEWKAFVGGLVAPNGVHLPVIRIPGATLYQTEDGRMRLVHTGGTDLYLDTEGKEVKLHASDAAPFRVIEVDRFLGITTALDEKGRLHIYQQNIRMGNFDLGLPILPELPLAMAVARGAGTLFISNGRRILLTNNSGKVRKEIDTHYDIGKLVCSPNGRLLATSDQDTSVIRVYNGLDLTPTYQRFAIDVMAEATQVQLIADLPSRHAALSALTLNDNGVMAFAISGMVCVADMGELDTLPQAHTFG